MRSWAVYRPIPPGDRYRSCSTLMPTRKKIVLSVQPVRDGGGSEHALIAMVRQLTAGGWECHVALPAPARLADEYAAAGARMHLVPMRRLTTTGTGWRWLAFAAAWPVTVLRLALLGRRVGATLVHTNSLHSWYGWAAARLLRVAHVWHAREVVVQSGAALRVERYLTAHFADKVVAISGAVAAQLRGGRPADDRVEVVLDEADPQVFFPARAGAFRPRVGIADDVPLVGSAARIDTWKGFEVLLDAFGTLREARPELQLVIAGAAVGGKDDYAKDLQRRASALEGVHWLGSRRDIAEVMADLDVFVQVSTEPEPFGLVLVEALACGVPVVAGAAGGPLEILPAAASPAGRLVTPGDPRALAEAVLSLLPVGPSSTQARMSRSPLRVPSPPRLAALFDEVLEGSPRSRLASKAKPALG